MMASISRISAGIGLSCGLGVWCGLALHICWRGQTHCHDQEEGPHRGGEQKGRKKKGEEEGDVFPPHERRWSWRESWEMLGIYTPSRVVLLAVYKSQEQEQQKHFFPQVDTSIARHLSQTSNSARGSEVKRCNFAARLLLCSSHPTWERLPKFRKVVCVQPCIKTKNNFKIKSLTNAIMPECILINRFIIFNRSL